MNSIELIAVNYATLTDQNLMQPERWQKIERLFGEALALSSAERPDFLAKMCGDDFDLRDEIFSMLAEDSNAEFLCEPIFNVGARLLDADELHGESEFGSYQLQKLLGRGGMGAVYLARDTRLERLVALKILPVSVVENDADVARFRQEARAASGVSHPNVAHIYEFGECGGRWFLAMEYVAGKTLRELLKNQSLDNCAIWQIVEQIIYALAATHQRGIVHWDIKPENIMVADGGAVKVLDFGLAKLDARLISQENKNASLTETANELIIGTVAYMSPEQIRGARVDSRTDLWSLGVLLFEMFGGKRPFAGESAGDMQSAILNQDAAISECPQQFRLIVGKLLQKDAKERYQSADDLLVDWQILKECSNTEKSLPNIFDTIKNHKVLVGGLLILLLVSTGAGFRIFNNYPSVKIESATTINSIAVLPFVNENGDTEDYLSDGLTESLIGKLSRLSQLSVKARSSVFQYKGQAVDPQTVGRELSVQAILLGRVIEQNEEITVNLDLVNAQTGSKIWSRRFSRKNSDLVVLEAEIVREISANLYSRLSGADAQILEKNYTKNAEAYRLYLLGRYHWNKRTAKDLQKSIEYYEQAVALDSQFALAFAGLADTYLLLPGFAVSSMHEAFPKAKAAARKALELDDTLAEAHNALAYALFNYDWNAAEAEREIKLAVEINPNYATTHQWYGNSILLATGRFDAAIAEAKQARELEPLSLIINADLGTTYLFARRTDESIEQLKKTIEMDDNFAYAHVNLGRAYLMQMDFPAAIAQCEKAASLSDDPRVSVILARIYAKLGKREKARQLLDDLTKFSKQKYVSAYYFALVYVGLGENDKAFEWLEKAIQDREGRMTYLKIDPLMDELRADPRFEDFVRRVNLESKPLDSETQVK